VGTGSEAIVAGFRRHPILITAPIAALALGAGYAAQALLRPGPTASDRQLLDTLIASPQPSLAARSSGEEAVEKRSTTREGAPLDSTAGVRAHKAAGTAAGTALPLPAEGPGVSLEIRVALLKLSATPSLGASGPWQAQDRQGRLLARGTAGERPDGSRLLASHPEVWLRPGAGHHLVADGKAYAGTFRLLRASDGFQVVNHIPLESYISSVVGGEMPTNWSMEALRAQAVAARSYAMAHMARPADAHWHLGDTTRWQNYTGLAAVNQRTVEATTSTNGVILSYQGGIVESLYAATHQISQEAHGHLGASMSQHGAQDLAQQGLRYNEILGRYYRGASLARLEAGAS
jgi:hypothetical protein